MIFELVDLFVRVIDPSTDHQYKLSDQNIHQLSIRDDKNSLSVVRNIKMTNESVNLDLATVHGETNDQSTKRSAASW